MQTVSLDWYVISHCAVSCDLNVVKAKEYLPAHALRRILALQTELMKAAPQPPADRISTASGIQNSHGAAARPATAQRALLSSNFTAPLQTGTRAAGSLGRNILSAGDKLRDLIIPESIASVVSAGMWSTGFDKVGLGMGAATGWMGGGKAQNGNHTGRTEKARDELEDLLASSCPLCESVVAGLDKGFVREGEDDSSWEI